MSYILDALKKSEIQRQQGRVPDLTTLPANVGAPISGASAGRSPWMLGAAAVVLAAVAGLVLWWQPWRAIVEVQPLAAAPVPAAAPPAKVEAEAPLPPTRERAAVVAAAPPVPAPAPAMPAAVAPQPTPEPVPKAQPVAPQPTPAPAPKPQPAVPQPTPVAAPAAAAAHVGAKAQAARPADSVPPAAAAPEIPPAPAPARRPPAAPVAAVSEREEKPVEAPPSRVLNFSELPAAVRRNVPPLNVSGYSYAEEAEARMVVINDRMLREGDVAAAGVRVDRIGAEGVILDYKGYRFRPAP